VKLDEERSLEGWTPEAGRDASLAEIVELAFDYRGDVTLLRVGAPPLVGYLYNRDRDVPAPFVMLVDPAGVSHTVRYAELTTIHFTGKDTAAGKSYEAWLRRKAETAAGPGA
jgi:hypothetical protein